MRLWLDDVRPAPSGWIWVKTVNEMLERLGRGGVDEVSLDHDLDYSDPAHTGAEVAVWLRARALAGHPVPVVHVHTANPAAAAQMAMLRRQSEHETGQWNRYVKSLARRSRS